MQEQTPPQPAEQIPLESQPQPTEQPQQPPPAVPSPPSQPPTNSMQTKSFFVRHKWIVLIFIVLFSLILFFIIFANNISKYLISRQFPDDTDPEIIAQCEMSNGEWAHLSDGCGDSCSLLIDPHDTISTQAFAWNCDCGDDKCWDGEECILNSSAENDADINKPIPGSNDNNVVCTAEAMICPDGSSVGRIPPDCEFELCQVNPTSISNENIQPTQTIQSSTPSRQELFDLVYVRKDELLAQSGTVATDIKFTSASLFDENIYTVSFSWIDSQGNQIATEGRYVLVGLVNGVWTASIDYDENYCNWLINSDKDEATKYFMGIEYCAN